jgi:ABC-type transport system involved in multi-copper enzyme maturation permease subunit
MSANGATPAQSLVRPRDLWNPILVKEVRQALRGKTFRYTFLGTLAAVLLATLTSLIGTDSVFFDAEAYFISVYFCLVVAVVAIVPFGAFQAMGGEWDESTYDLLVLSDLRPRRIVLGKLYAAGVQALLFTAAFLPFLMVAFLLPGIDLRACALLIVFALVVGCLAALVGTTLSTLSRQRFARVVLMVTLGGVIAMVLPMILAFAAAVMRDPTNFLGRDALIVIAMMVCVTLVGAAYTFALACNMLAHPEENRSTDVRLITTFGAVLLMACTATVNRTWSMVGTDFISGMTISGIVIVSFVSVLFVTERRELGRRVRLRVPRSSFFALVTAPWFPGGGRGVLLHVFHVVAIALTGICFVAYERPGAANFFSNGVGALLAAVPLSIIFVTVVPGLLAWMCEAPGTRIAVRIATPVVAFLVILVPGIVGALTGDHDLRKLDHFGNPIRIIDMAWDQNGLAPGLYLSYVALALVALLINAPRLVRSVTETLDAARANRLRAESSEDTALGRGRADAGPVT